VFRGLNSRMGSLQHGDIRGTVFAKDVEFDEQESSLVGWGMEVDVTLALRPYYCLEALWRCARPTCADPEATPAVPCVYINSVSPPLPHTAYLRPPPPPTTRCLAVKYTSTAQKHYHTTTMVFTRRQSSRLAAAAQVRNIVFRLDARHGSTAFGPAINLRALPASLGGIDC
jgi:hypothetical protein